MWVGTPLKKTDTVIIGAGHSGLAMSRHLERRSIDHVLLERGEIANSWRTERWDSLNLLTPNWLSRLPDYAYEGDDPDGYMDMSQLIQFLDTYAKRISAPVETRTNVTAVTPDDGGYVIATDRGDWRARAVVIASGHCNIPAVPKIASDLPSDIQTVTPMHYRNPDQLSDGGVLIAGASATGVQLAAEIKASGRHVVLATGEHVRVPRIYRSKDIKWWMEVAGILGLPYNEVDDIRRARRVPSLQLVGLKNKSTLDLNVLTDAGVEIAGRIAGVTGRMLMFSGSLRNVCALADLKMNRLLNTIDEWATENGFDGKVDPPHRLDATRVPANPRLKLDLAEGNIKTIIWATGYHADLSWLKVQAFDARGRLAHDGGIMKQPGLYVLGMPYLRTRKSTLIDGADHDTGIVADHLTGYLAGHTAAE
jgi:putative flavoprotein involved in K+ transport